MGRWRQPSFIDSIDCIDLSKGKIEISYAANATSFPLKRFIPPVPDL
jgi:hypothetical protein